MKKIKLPTIDCQVVAEEIGTFIIRAVLNIQATGCVIGLSGGIDSTTTAYLIHNAFEKYNHQCKENNLELVGYILPSQCNTREDTSGGVAVAEALGIRHEVLSIEKILRAFESTNSEIVNHPFHMGNLMSRIRANVLSTKAASEHKILCGTGNKDEDFGIGYYTLFGDGAVHLSPIGSLSKRLVYKMGRYLKVPESIILRAPTAGLEPGQSDFKDLGYDYEMVEIVTEGLSQSFTPEQLKSHSDIRKMAEEQIKRYASMIGEKKFKTSATLIEDILERHRSALSKAEIIHPPVPKVSLKYP